MTGLDSITLDASGYLDMSSFADGSELPDDTLAGLRAALLSDPVDEPSGDDWSALMSDVAYDGERSDDGPFAVDGDDGGIAGVRDASGDDDPADTGSTGDDRDDDPDLDDDGVIDEAPVDDDPGGDEPGDGDTVDDGGTDFDVDVELGAGDLIGFDLSGGDDGLGIGNAASDLIFDDAPETASGADDVGDFL